jgi:hypothetical protein
VPNRAEVVAERVGDVVRQLLVPAGHGRVGRGAAGQCSCGELGDEEVAVGALSDRGRYPQRGALAVWADVLEAPRDVARDRIVCVARVAEVDPCRGGGGLPFDVARECADRDRGVLAERDEQLAHQAVRVG